MKIQKYAGETKIDPESVMANPLFAFNLIHHTGFPVSGISAQPLCRTPQSGEATGMRTDYRT